MQLFQINIDYVSGINYLLFHAHVPPIRKITVINESQDSLQNVMLSIEPSEDFAAALEIQIENIEPGGLVEIERIPIKLKGGFFASLTEMMKGEWEVKLNKEGEVLIQNSFEVELFAFDQWLGSSVVPELLAGFVLPNIPELSPLVHQAAKFLLEWTGNTSFDAYQSNNPNRVKSQMASLFQAVKNQYIIYQTVPASFGKMGQRIRLGDQVLGQKVGNCLDMTLLFASALEHIGLNPIIAVIEGHAFVGCWLIDDTFPDAVNDDPSLLSKRMASGINEILVLESTCMNAGNTLSFDLAVETSKKYFIDLKKFHYFVDLKRARFAGIYPLPQRRYDINKIELIEDLSFIPKEEVVSAPSTLEEGVRVEQAHEKINWEKQQLWERKLLDLSLRNNLLNLRLTRSSIQFIDVPIGELEDNLFEGGEYQVLHKPKDWENSPRDEGLYQSVSSNSPLQDLVQREFSQNRLRVYISEDELHQRLTFLYRSARQSMEENGANTLYLAAGLLRWYESPKSERPRFAPLLLIPVELIRKSVKVGYVVRGREEDTVLNVTLMEKLRQDFGVSILGLDPLPTDDSGVDIKAVFNIVRQAIMNQPRWEVEEKLFLGNFSFSKFILWNDIHSHADKLKKNPIVEGLLEGQLKENLKIFDLDNLDLHYNPSDILLPIPADSSQLEAICAAVEGHSFILHGPPGTGKSQTITNIIANALYRGKRVLFVAEKMAALSVVYSRLKSIGLDPFTLEIHSNKARKAEVLAQLKKSTEVKSKKLGFDIDHESSRINELKNELDKVFQKLHQETFHGISIFEIFSKYIKYEKFQGDLVVPEELVEHLDKSAIPNFVDYVKRLGKAAEQAGNPSLNHPFFGVWLKEYNVVHRDEIRDRTIDFIQNRKEYLKKLDELSKTVGFSNQFNHKDRHSLQHLCDGLMQIETFPEGIFEFNNIRQISDELLELISIGIENLKYEKSIDGKLDKAILKIDTGLLLRDWRIKSQGWFIPKFFGLRKIRFELQSYVINSRKLTNDEVRTLLEEINSYKERETILLESVSKVDAYQITPYFKSVEGLEALKVSIPILISLENHLEAISSSPEELSKIKSIITQELLQDKEVLLKLISSYQEIDKKDLNTQSVLKELMSVDLELKIGAKSDLSLKQAESWLYHIENLKEWHAWNQLKNEGKDFYLFDSIELMEKEGVSAVQIEGVILKAAYRKMAITYLKEHPELSEFSGRAFEERIKEFESLNDRFAKLAQEVLQFKLSSNIPDFSKDVSSSSETGILQRAIKSNGRGQSIRKLFGQIQNLIPRLSPCMLMSPISVAQFVDIYQEPFDLVIFDEASQMPTCEAVGAISRGKQLIVVGDPKQMPPTNFFSSMHFDDEDQNEDLESILDDCEALSVPSRQLRWHYRSKHESLIAFSNAKYYENSLFTFPSPDDQETKVKFVHVKGVYDRGKTRQNKIEAEEIVKEMIRRIKATDKKSIGVVTFSSVQQTLIEDLLMEKFRKDPKLEEIALSMDEPYFIKNLENVQGDERDVILFSVCYGPDENDYVALNFGPLNRDGGWRRLNVAVSRARYEMVIYSSLTSDQIDLNRSKAEGVAGLKAFLAFADKGKMALPQKVVKSNFDSGNGLSQAVSEFLQNEGFKVDIGVGTSGFKIDLAVVHPEKPNEYLLGILLDSKPHESSKSSIDRLLVQEKVLKLLGWQILKIWSLDWWDSPKKVGESILSYLEEIQKAKPEEVIEKEIAAVNELAEDSEFLENEQIDEVNGIQLPYTLTSLAPGIANSEEFYFNSHASLQLQQLNTIINTEGPILQTLLSKRLLDAWNISRLGGRLQSRIEDLLSRLSLTITEEPNGGKCYWPEGIEPAEYDNYRVFSDDLTKRNADELPVREVCNALTYILNQQISLPKEDLIREGAKEFGFSRTGSVVNEKMEIAIQEMLDSGKAIHENGRIKLILI